MAEPRPLLILGAGCAGLSLCVALLRAGVRDPIVLLDRRERFDRDRTWCFWDVRPTPFTRLISHSWPSWSVHTHTREAVQHSVAHPYVHLDARDFYAACLEEIAGHPSVELRLGERVESVHDAGDRVEVVTSRGVLEGARAFDALAAGSLLARAEEPGSIELGQSFLGLEVRTDQPVFDPGRCTLMDFRVPQDAGLHFVYVLPFSERRALVEDTSIGRTRRRPTPVGPPSRSTSPAATGCRTSPWTTRSAGASP